MRASCAHDAPGRVARAAASLPAGQPGVKRFARFHVQFPASPTFCSSLSCVFLTIQVKTSVGPWSPFGRDKLLGLAPARGPP